MWSLVEWPIYFVPGWIIFTFIPNISIFSLKTGFIKYNMQQNKRKEQHFVFLFQNVCFCIYIIFFYCILHSLFWSICQKRGLQNGRKKYCPKVKDQRRKFQRWWWVQTQIRRSGHQKVIRGEGRSGNSLTIILLTNSKLLPAFVQIRQTTFTKQELCPNFTSILWGAQCKFSMYFSYELS